MIGFLMFSIVETRSDIVFTTFIISHFINNLEHQYTKIVKTIIQYLKRSKKYRITYNGQSKLLIERYSNFDQIRYKENWKSISNFIFIFNRSLVSWYSKKQFTIALSSIEAEYIALILAAKKAILLCLLLIKLDFLQSDKQFIMIKIFQNNTYAQTIYKQLDIVHGKEKTNFKEMIIPLKNNNQGSIVLAHNPTYYSKMKHIDIQYYYICDEIVSQKIELSYIPTEKIIANRLTKALTYIKFYHFIQQINII